MIKIINLKHEKGLHCRPSVKLAQLVKTFDVDVQLIKDGQRANANDVLHVLSLGITPGDVVVEVNGNDAEKALTAIEELFGKLDEDES